MMGYGFMGAGIFMWIFWLLIIGGGIWLLTGLFNQRNYPGNRPDNTPDAKEILDRRYAKGELTREEYDHMKQDLKS